MTQRLGASALLLVCMLGCATYKGQQGGSRASVQSSNLGPLQDISIVSETLSSGYRVIIARAPDFPGRAPRIHVGSYLLHGSMQESKFGWAHLMEHVVANNRSSIAGPPRPDTSIKFIDSNALTRPYYTSFVSVVQPGLLPFTVHSRMARAGRFENDSAVFATQVGRVLTELERDMTFRFPAYKALIAITTGHSPILADELNLIRNTSREELAAAMAPIYQPHNAVIVVAGNLNMDSTRALLSETAQRLKLNDPHKPSAQIVITPTLRFNQSAIIEHQNRTGHYVVAIGWSKPKLGDQDQIAELVADELLLGHGPGVADPARSDSSAAALRLAQSLGGSAFWDGRAGTWAAPDLIDTGPNIHAIVFSTDRKLTVKEVRASVSNALRDIQRNGTSDQAINAARENLASFYERWFFEPTYRVLADHLMAFAATGRDPNDVKLIPSMIRQVKPSEVRAALKRYFVDAPANVVILPPEPTAK